MPTVTILTCDTDLLLLFVALTLKFIGNYHYHSQVTDGGLVPDLVVRLFLRKVGTTLMAFFIQMTLKDMCCVARVAC